MKILKIILAVTVLVTLPVWTALSGFLLGFVFQLKALMAVKFFLTK